MIELKNVSKTFYVDGFPKVVADDISVVFPTRRAIALLGRNGAGKSSLLAMIAGKLEPSSGRIVSDGTISWPVGFAGSFHGDLTGAQNVRFVARVYGVDTDELVSYVEAYAELDEHFHLPVRTYSSGMRARLAFGVSMGVRFDTYLVDEVTSVGDAAFRAKSERTLLTRLQSSGAIVVSHNLQLLRRICKSGAVIEKGKITWFEEVEDAIALHEKNMDV